MIFKRKIYRQLLEWKNSKINNSALLIEGARRIGKSTIVEEFAKNEFDDYIMIDFMYENDEMKNLFKDLKNLDLFFSNFFLLAGKTLKPGSLIIFDEIQRCPLARQSIKKLVKDGRYYYIETGSLLSIRDNTDNITIPSEERRIEMYPLDYEEFLWAFGDDSTASLLRSIYSNNQNISEDIHKELMKKFRLYMVLGGMPKVISIFQMTNSYMEAEKEKQDILKLYKDDLLKHDRKYGTQCRTLYDNLSNELMSQSSRYNISKNSNNKRIKQLDDTIFDLDDSKIVKLCHHASEPQYGLELSKNISKFKMYSCDAGLLVTSIYKDKSLNVEDIYKKLVFGKINSNFGKIFESIVSQALVSNGYTPFYHTYTIEEEGKIKRYEIDFMVESAGKVVAIEVKSGSNFTTSSLNNLKIKYPQLKFKKIVISNKTLSIKDNVMYLPIYMTFVL
ncbi:MAG: ATP-binding protein [Acholeplasmatales bacterium]|nr:ATP-binding protein [Acholeplasmatales bacterium]